MLPLRKFRNKSHLLTYLLHGAESCLWTNWFAASQEIPRISRNPKVHYRTHKRPPPVSILGQPNPVHIPTSHLLVWTTTLKYTAVVWTTTLNYTAVVWTTTLKYTAVVWTTTLKYTAVLWTTTFNIFTAPVHIEGRSSNRNLRTRQAVVTGTHLGKDKYPEVGQADMNWVYLTQDIDT